MIFKHDNIVEADKHIPQKIIEQIYVTLLRDHDILHKKLFAITEFSNYRIHASLINLKLR